MRFSWSVTPGNLTCWNFRKNWTSNCVAVEWVFLVGDYHIWSFINVRESLLALSHLSTLTNSLFSVAWTFIMSLSDVKTVVFVCKMYKTHLIWGSVHVIDIEKKKCRAEHRALRNTWWNVFIWGTAVFDWDMFPITQIRLEQLCLTPLMTLCRNLLINISWLSGSNAFEKSKYTAMLLCLQSKDK